MFALDKHRTQARKYTGDPYASHLAEVAGIVATVAGNPERDISVAWLHDVREDQGVGNAELEERFGLEIARGVALLSDFEEGNRATRKALSRNRLSCAPGWVQTIKCADLISNTSSIALHDPKFAAVYLEEKRLLLEVLTRADPRLLARARDQVSQLQGCPV
ncbi:HD domain-containing protein [Achromobacter sp. AGC39]